MENKIVPQKEFNSLGEFIEGQNNYYIYFVSDTDVGRAYRQSPCFIRFQKNHSKIENELTKETTRVNGVYRKFHHENRRFFGDVEKATGEKLPYEQLWESYKIMSNLVFESDPEILRKECFNNCYLIR